MQQTDNPLAEALPPLKELNVEHHDIGIWSRDPVTRYWFKNIANQIEYLRKNVTALYDRESIDRTSLRFAETVGQIVALSDILRAYYKDNQGNDITIARQEDIKELFDGADEE